MVTNSIREFFQRKGQLENETSVLDIRPPENNTKGTYILGTVRRPGTNTYGIYAAAVTGCYAMRLFREQLNSREEFGALRAPGLQADGSPQPGVTQLSRKDYENHRRDNGEVMSLIGMFFGMHGDTMIALETESRLDSHEGGVFDKVMDMLARYFGCEGEYAMKTRFALMKSMLFSAFTIDFGNGYANDLIRKICWAKYRALLDKNKGKDVLPFYYRHVKCCEALCEGKDTLRVNIMKSNEPVSETGMVEYCEKAISWVESKIADYHREEGKELSNTVLLNISALKLEVMVQVFSTCGLGQKTDGSKKTDLRNAELSFDYDPSNPPLVDLARQDVTDDYLKGDRVLRKWYDTVPGVRKEQAPAVQEVPDTAPRGPMAAFVRKQHGMLVEKNLVCTAYTDLGNRYVDIGESDGNGTILGSVYDRLSSGRSVLIYGSAGMGKSTLVYLEYEMLYNDYMRDGSRPAPVYVSPGLFDEPVDPEDLLAVAVAMYDPDSDAASGHGPGDVVLLIDAVDEYIGPDSPELQRLRRATAPFVKLVAGRTEVAKGLVQGFEDPPIDLKNSISEKLFLEIFRMYMPEGVDKSPEDFVLQFHDMVSTPMVAAIAATYLTNNNEFAKLDPTNYSIYDHIMNKVVADKLCAMGINRFKTKAVSILCEYAWCRYSRRYMSFDDRVERVAAVCRCDFDRTSRVLTEFTVTDFSDDRVFRHKSIQDFLAAKWLMKLPASDSIPDDWLNKGITPEIQHFIGDYMKGNHDGSDQFMGFCEKQFMRYEDLENVKLRDNYQSKLIHLISRAVYMKVPTAMFTFKKLVKFIMETKRKSAPMATALVCMSIAGVMDYEQRYVDYLKNDARIAEISRVLFMMYEGDVDPLDLEFEDSVSYFEHTATKYLDDMKFNLYRADRYRNVFRVHTVIVNSLFDKGYTLSPERMEGLASVDIPTVVSAVMCDSFRANLDRFGVSQDEYEASLVSELEGMKARAAERLQRSDS